MTGKFDASSRYAATETAAWRAPDGRSVAYLRRRFVPPPGAETLAERRVEEGDRPDTLAARMLGDPLLSWRLGDSNGVMHPEELTEEIGRLLRAALDGGGGA